MRGMPGLNRSLFAAVVLGLGGMAYAGAADNEVTMYRSPTCGCCGKWAEHMRANGFSVTEISTRKMKQIKLDAGVPKALGSCHTAKIGGYVIEGHVPAADVKRLLADKPGIAGIAVPGMPEGSPGMEGPYKPDRYDVISFDGNGATAVYASH